MNKIFAVVGTAFILFVADSPLSAHESVVQVTVDMELDAPQCLINFVTVRGRHTGRIIAIGFDDRHHQWSLSGGLGYCTAFNGKDSPLSESTIFGIVEASPFLEVTTQIDQRCTTLGDKKFWARTLASGPWNTLHPSNDPFEETDCKVFRCS